MHLTDDQLRAVLARAEEIQRASAVSAAWNAEVQIVVEAAEEMGLSRQAVERALAERRDLFPEPPRAGQLTWARSANGRFYVAEVLSVSPHGAVVKFLNGGEASIGLDGLRPCGFLPGDRVVCSWPNWGTWTGTVIWYDPNIRKVELSDGWGSRETFHIADVWMAPPKNETESRTRFFWKAMAIGGTLGTAIGAIATFLLLR